jgi:hypothetical protein
VASIDSRLVRGELLDAQQWTARNWTMRSLTALGSIAVAFEFPFSTDVTKGIGAFNGTVVPGAAALWPDGTVNQLNRISDFGFKTDKIIPKQGSDVLVAFFPIKRFLTTGFRKVFLSDPAAWFVPDELLADPKTEKIFESFVKPLTGGLAEKSASELGISGATSFKETMLRAVLVDCSSDSVSEKEPATCILHDLINGVSLNNIRVVLEGVMTLDVAAVPATIYGVDFDSGSDASIWTKTGVKQTGSITGVYLTGGVPSVVDGSGKEIPDVTITPVADGSSDTELKFTMTVTKCIPSTTKVFFVVNKPQDTTSTATAAGTAKPSAAAAKKPGASVASTSYELPVQPATTCSASAGGKEGGPDEGASTKPAGTAPTAKEQKPEEKPKKD